MLQLHCMALKPVEIEAKVLPEYAKHRVDFDINTYNHLMKYYLKTLDLDKVLELYSKAQDQGLKANPKMLSILIEVGIRKRKSVIVIDTLK